MASSNHGRRPHHAVGMPTGTRPRWGHPAGPGARGDPTSASKPAAKRSPRHFPPSRASLPNVLQWPSPRHHQRLETSNRTRVQGKGADHQEKGDSGQPQQRQTPTVASRALGTKPEPLNVPLGPVLPAHGLNVSAKGKPPVQKLLTSFLPQGLGPHCSSTCDILPSCHPRTPLCNGHFPQGLP